MCVHTFGYNEAIPVFPVFCWFTTHVTSSMILCLPFNYSSPYERRVVRHDQFIYPVNPKRKGNLSSLHKLCLLMFERFYIIVSSWSPQDCPCICSCGLQCIKAKYYYFGVERIVFSEWQGTSFLWSKRVNIVSLVVI